MQSEDIDECFATAERLVREAGKIVMEGFRTAKTVNEKTHASDLVTAFDTRVEDFLFGSLKEQYPTHKFIGEENTFVSGLKPTLSDAPTWIIDPIDGTLNFVHNLPHVAISVALVVNQKTVIGVVYNPVMGEMYTAVANKGAFRNSEPIRVSSVKDMSKALVNVIRAVPLQNGSSKPDLDYGLVKHITAMSQGNVSFKSCVVEMCYVAAGSIDSFYFDHSYIRCWDVAAAALLIEEAGGVVLDITGGPFDMMSGRAFCAGTQDLATSVLKEIQLYIASATPV